MKKIVEEGHQKIVNKYSVFLKNLIDEMLSKDPEKRPKVCEILERKEIKMEVINFFLKCFFLFKKNVLRLKIYWKNTQKFMVNSLK